MPETADRLAVDLAAIGERLNAATEGPWTLEIDHDDSDDAPFARFPYGFILPKPKIERRDSKYRDYDYLYTEVSDLAMADAGFLVAARSDVPRLLAAVEAVLDLIARWNRRPPPGTTPSRNARANCRGS
jgi:hypothetical protein